MFRPHGSKTQDLSQRTSEPIFSVFPKLQLCRLKLPNMNRRTLFAPEQPPETPPLSARNRPRFSDLGPRFSPASTEMPPVLPRFSLLAQCTRPPVLPRFFLRCPRFSPATPAVPPVLPRFSPGSSPFPRFSPGSPPVLPANSVTWSILRKKKQFRLVRPQTASLGAI